LFMAGLAAGGFFFRYRERLPASTADPLPFAARRLRRWLIAFSAAILALAALLSILVSWNAWRAAPLAAQVLLAIMMIAAGAITGAEFAMVGHLQAAVGVPLSRRSAWLESADHLGAAVGALATGIVLLPCLGIPMTLVLLAFLKWGASLWLASTTTAPIPLTTPPQS